LARQQAELENGQQLTLYSEDLEHVWKVSGG
jgi:hypothetical protein